MGQAWCKERTTKAQDSKSPLDRVFVRCAHQIYPTLKQDGSVLGGATQRVTSSEIGYAGSPPREALTRGESVDSVDRPFHPSEWVDVNLEVPSAPCSVITNLTANTSLCQTTTLSSTGSNLKNITPIPPPRRRRKNRGRPLPPKPTEVIEAHGNVKPAKNIEPLYSSVKLPKLKNLRLEISRSGNENADEDKENRNNENKEDPAKIPTIKIHEYKVTDNGRTLAIGELTEGRDESTTGDSGDRRERNAQRNEERYRRGCEKRKDGGGGGESEDEDEASENGKKDEDSDYEKFSKGEEPRNSSTPKVRPEKNTERESSSGKDLREFVSRTIMEDDDNTLQVVHQRPKNLSTVSLPNYDELEVVKKEVERETEGDESDRLTLKKSGRGRNISTTSLPPSEIFGALPEGSTDRLEKYMTRCRSFGSLQPHEILDKLKAHGEQIDSSDEDEWGGLDDWDLGVVEYSEPNDGRSPLEPSSRLRERKNTTPPKFDIGGDVVTVAKKEEPRAPDNRDDSPKKNENQTPESDKKTLTIPRNASFEVPKSPTSLKSALKAEANRKISMPARLSSEKPSSPLEEWFLAQERSVTFSDAPRVEEEYANTPGHLPVKPSESKKKEAEYDTSYPFNGSRVGPVDIDTFFDAPQDLTGGELGSGDSSSRRERPKNLTRSLSNESEPFDGYEEKELTLDIRSQYSSIGKISRTISDESIPAEMNDDDDNDDVLPIEENNVPDEKSTSKDSKTPPPSPEPKIHAEILKNDHFSGARAAGLESQGDDGGESNLSSMTPSLTELEAALSDMLEKEDRDEPGTHFAHDRHSQDSEDSDPRRNLETNESSDRPIEPKILPKPIEREMVKDLDRREEATDLERGEIGPGQISSNDIGAVGKAQVQLEAKKVVDDEKSKRDQRTRKNPFEDTDDDDDDEDRDDESVTVSKMGSGESAAANPFDGEPPEKPSRLNKVPIDRNTPETPDAPTPPQRRNKQGGAISPVMKSSATSREDSEFPIKDSSPHPNDRLI